MSRSTSRPLPTRHHTNLLNAIVAGTGAPDLCTIDDFYLTQYTDGLTDLSAHRAEYEDYFVPPTLDLGSYQGKLYGLASDSEPIGLFYRKDLWDQYGIKEEDIETWADLAEAGNKVNQDSNGDVSLYAMFSNDHYLYEVLAVEQGFAGYYFDETDTKVIVDDPKRVEAVGVIKQLWESKGTLQNPVEPTLRRRMVVLLKSGKVTCQVIGPAWFRVRRRRCLSFPVSGADARAGDRVRGAARRLRVPHHLRHPVLEPDAGPRLGVRGHDDDGRWRPKLFDKYHILPGWQPASSRS